MSNKKLIKLITNDSNANFDNQFRNEIVINKNSEIALHSLSMVREDVKININGANDRLIFDLNNQQYTVNMTHGNYSVHNTFNLLNEINRDINSLINIADADANNKIFGSYVRVSINYDNRLEFPRFEAQFIRPPFLGLRGNTLGHSIVLNNCLINNNTELVKSTDAPNASLTAANAVFPIPFIRGCGSFRAKIKLFVANINPADPNGFIIGLTKHPEKLDNAANPITVADIVFGVSIDTPTSNYFQIVNGVATDTGISPVKVGAGTPFTEHDYIDFTQSNNRIVCTIYQDGATQNIFSEPNPYSSDAYTSYQDNILATYSNESLYGCVIFKAGASRIVLDGVRIHTGDGSFIPSIRSDDVGNLPLTTYVMPEPQPSGVNCLFTLEFTNIKTAKFFGFSSITPALDISRQAELNDFILNICGVNPREITMIFGDMPFTVLDTSDIYIVEMLNIPLDSYEAYTEQRKNVLAVIPVNEENVNQSDYTLQYESPNLNYISIKNDYEFSLRNIRARVVNSRFEPIDTTGSTHLTVFIRDKGE